MTQYGLDPPRAICRSVSRSSFSHPRVFAPYGLHKIIYGAIRSFLNMPRDQKKMSIIIEDWVSHGSFVNITINGNKHCLPLPIHGLIAVN